MTEYVLKSTKGGMRTVRKDGFLSVIELSEPRWTPDEQAATCEICSSPFTLTNRKHHCRRCGRLVCSSCCKTRLEVYRIGFRDPVRVCVQCKPMVEHENEFFTRMLPVVQEGADVKVKFADGSFDGRSFCRLSQDCSQLEFLESDAPLSPADGTRSGSLGARPQAGQQHHQHDQHQHHHQQHQQEDRQQQGQPRHLPSSAPTVPAPVSVATMTGVKVKKDDEVVLMEILRQDEPVVFIGGKRSRIGHFCKAVKGLARMMSETTSP